MQIIHIIFPARLTITRILSIPRGKLWFRDDLTFFSSFPLLFLFIHLMTIYRCSGGNARRIQRLDDYLYVYSDNNATAAIPV